MGPRESASVCTLAGDAAVALCLRALAAYRFLLSRLLLETERS